MENMEIWDKLKTPPPDALKTILAGRLKGKSDISPQWRYEAITEVYGVCGIGWKYTIDKLWTEAGSDNQIMCFALVSFYHRLEGTEWSDPIPGIGGSMLVTKESSGLHSSDEGYKMAVTDALSVALKMIGVGADVYRGLSDSKYNKQKQTTPLAENKPSGDVEKARKATHAKATKVGVSHEELTYYAKLKYLAKSTTELTIDQWREIYDILNKDVKAFKSLIELAEKPKQTCPNTFDPIDEVKCKECEMKEGCPALENN